MEAAITAKPREVRIGVLCLWVALALGLFGDLQHVIRFGTSVSPVVLCCSYLLAVMFSAFFIHTISLGRSWARATYLVLLLLGVAITARGLVDEFSLDPVAAMMTVGRVVVLACAAHQLFSYPSDAWFASRKQATAS
ncbi:hypothetical protein [Dyella agri]|uniref:Uncharacterized protein n=1 Tax=Dyella agri TaxID=1926869 RepID=A0ABW8KG27_9GAMM